MCIHHSLSLSLFLEYQNVSRSFGTLPAPILKSAVSPRNLVTHSWLRNQMWILGATYVFATRITDLRPFREISQEIPAHMCTHRIHYHPPPFLHLKFFEMRSMDSIIHGIFTWFLNPGMCSFSTAYSLVCCSVAKYCPALCNPMDCSAPGSAVLHYLPKFTQVHAHWVSNAISTSNPFIYMLVNI